MKPSAKGGLVIMKKTANGWNIYFIVGICLSFCLGFAGCYFTFSLRMDKDEQENTQGNSLVQEDSIEKEPECSEDETEPLPKDETDTLSEEDRAFLEEHVYGQWRFSNRVVEIDENNNIHYGATANISDVGVEELKQTVVILYEEESVDFPVKIGQNSFSHAQDMYLFAAYGGFSCTIKPVYKISEMNTDKVVLSDMYNWAYRYEIQMPGWEDYIHVTYHAKRNSDSFLCGNYFTYFCSDIYVNPNDTDTIYVDFCGLWEMTRDENEYGTYMHYEGDG